MFPKHTSGNKIYLLIVCHFDLGVLFDVNELVFRLVILKNDYRTETVDGARDFRKILVRLGNGHYLVRVYIHFSSPVIRCDYL